MPSVEFEHEDQRYTAHYLTDEHIGKSWVVSIEVTAPDPSLMESATKAMERDLERVN